LKTIFTVFGGYSVGVTPVLIPNTEVKSYRADDTAWETVWESRSLPKLFENPHPLLSGWGFLFAVFIFTFIRKSLDEGLMIVYNFAPLLGTADLIRGCGWQKKSKKR
jgi:hypothetical protein